MIICISIHAPLAGRDALRMVAFYPEWVISIHAPLAGRDIILPHQPQKVKISIHAPLAGRDSKNAQILLCRFVQKKQFKKDNPQNTSQQVRFTVNV